MGSKPLSHYEPDWKRLENLIRRNMRIPEGKDNAQVAVAVSNLVLAEVMMNLDGGYTLAKPEGPFQLVRGGKEAEHATCSGRFPVTQAEIDAELAKPDSSRGILLNVIQTLKNARDAEKSLSDAGKGMWLGDGTLSSLIGQLEKVDRLNCEIFGCPTVPEGSDLG